MNILSILALYSDINLLQFLVFLLLPLFFTIVINRAFSFPFLNGILVLQVTFVANFAPFIAVIMNGRAPNCALYFLTVEVLFYILCAYFYASLLPFAKSLLSNISPALDKYRGSIYICSVIVTLYTLHLSRQGDSRIEYMLTGTYSFVKYADALSVSLLFALICSDILKKRQTCTIANVILAAASSYAAQSKASFLISIVSAFLFVRDFSVSHQFTLRSLLAFPRRLSRPSWKLSRIYIASIIAAVPATYVLISLIGVVPMELLERVVLYGESGYIILDPQIIEEPSSISNTLSTIALLHRGVARLLGEPSALNPDTLFGFALAMKVNGGINTFTGPNARASSYFISAFSSPLMFFLGLLSTLAFFKTLSIAIAKILNLQSLHQSLLVLPQAMAFNACLFIPNNVSQDYYVLLSQWTLWTIILLFLSFGNNFISQPRSIA